MNEKAKAQNNKTSLYAIGAVSSTTTNKKIGIDNLIILSRDPKQLVYEYVFKDTKPNEDRTWNMSVRECVGGISINTQQKFYNFVKDYLNDQKRIEAGELPEELAHDFYVFKNKAEAEQELHKLSDQQDQRFNNIYSFMQPYISKQKLVVIDLIEALAKYVPVAIKEMLDDPEMRKTFEKNMAQFKHKQAE